MIDQLYALEGKDLEGPLWGPFFAFGASAGTAIQHTVTLDLPPNGFILQLRGVAINCDPHLATSPLAMRLELQDLNDNTLAVLFQDSPNPAAANSVVWRRSATLEAWVDRRHHKLLAIGDFLVSASQGVDASIWGVAMPRGNIAQF